MDPGHWPPEGLCVYVVSFSGGCQGGGPWGDLVNGHDNMHVFMYVFTYGESNYGVQRISVSPVLVQRGNATAVLGRGSLMEGINLA